MGAEFNSGTFHTGFRAVVNPAKRAAGVHLAPVAAYGIATRDAALDALAKLDDGTYGDCETCGCSIPIARLGAVPYARHCVACQERDEIGWIDFSDTWEAAFASRPMSRRAGPRRVVHVPRCET